MSVFQALSAGKTGHPAISGPDPAGAGRMLLGGWIGGRWLVGAGLIDRGLGAAAVDGWIVATADLTELDVCSAGRVVAAGEVVDVGEASLTR